MTNHITGAAGLLAVGLLLAPAPVSAAPIGPMTAPVAGDAITTVQYGYGYGRGYGRGYGYGGGYGRRYFGGPRFGYGYGRPRFGYGHGYGRGYGYGRRRFY